jgi:hypothetical protein
VTVVDWCQNGAIALLLALVGLLLHDLHEQGKRIGAQESWAHERDPESFGIYPDLEPEPPRSECVGVHPVGKDGKTCEVCGVVLV